MAPHSLESPAKKQSKWSADEDALIIDLRGGGMKWEDISKRLPGRSAISCRLHYQNYLERRSEWDEERKNKLARLYERFKPDMWAKVAEEMAIPWRAAEAMHWQLGEADMARRAGVVPFSLSSSSVNTHAQGHHASPSLGHAHFQSHPGPSFGSGYSVPRYHRPSSSHSTSSMQGGVGPAYTARSLAARRDVTPRSAPLTNPADGYVLAEIGAGVPMGRGGQYLPSVTEMTTGVSPYNTPAYAESIGGGYRSPGPRLPAIEMLGVAPRMEGKRGQSPDMGSRDTSRKRQ